ncbi:DUF3558 domain-containing protein [Mycolicibacterium elephantis]|uniref:DUF3558 domain-containing protein n=1 Tax=Mycolicibacterium elephantis TaxID=81858 RepID=UPI00103D9F59|nr:DUF3558 domain-containing protein [Mycolicibacterium elephantis]
MLVRVLSIGVACVLIVSCSNDSPSANTAVPSTPSDRSTNAAAGTPAEKPTAQGLPNPCSVLTADDIQQVFGLSTEPGERDPSQPDGLPDALGCGYRADTDLSANAPPQEVFISVIPPSAGVCEGLKELGAVGQPGAPEAVDVDGLGVTTTWMPGDPGYALMCAEADGVEVQIGADTVPAATQDQVKRLMEVALARL